MNGGIIYLLVFLVIGFMLYTTYSQQRRAKKAQEQLQRMVKKGDEVLTVGGMFGTVRKVGDDYVVLEVADRTKVRFLRRAIREIVNEEEYVEDEYDEAEYDEDEAVDEGDDEDETDEDDEDYGEDESESDETELTAASDGAESAADDAVDEPADAVKAPEPPTPPKGT